MSTAEKERLYFNAFNQFPQIGSVRFRKLLNFFPNMEAAWKAPSAELEASGLEQSVAQAVAALRPQIDPEAEYEKLTRASARLITINDEEYPALLREISNPPVTLYIRGDLTAEDDTAVAIVGTRRHSMYGGRVVADLVRDLANANITIVSGLALGIDALAHQAAISNHGRTVAVLACGVDAIYPASNRLIGERILDGAGALVSELPMGAPPLKHHFPFRNRIISGLSLGTVIIEAAADSGSLITAQHALDQNRQVFAVPGSIYNPTSIGPHNLLKMGAKLVTSASDVLEELNLGDLQAQLLAREIVGDTEEEQQILNLLSREPMHADQVAKTTGLTAATVAAQLTILEMKGKIKNLGANQYVIAR